MAAIFDVADWFLSRESMTPKKLQKLCYYFKAWSLALYGEDFLPDSDFEAWVHGPVNPKLYRKYKSYYWQEIPQTSDNSEKFQEKELDILTSVWESYGDMTGNALEAQTHAECPWRKARIGVDEFTNCRRIIRKRDMKSYYRELYEAHQGE